MTIARHRAAARAALTMASLLALAATTVARADPPARKLTVAASANLRLALEEVAGAFERRNPGVKVDVTFGATGTLYAQIRNGAPFDLFLGADREVAARIQEAGLAGAPAFHYATGRLVLWIAGPIRVNPATQGLRGLADPTIRKVAIANPAVAPYGVAAEKAMQTAGVLEAVRPKLVLGESILQVIQFVQSGNVQAAFVPWSMAKVPPLAALGRHSLVPAASYPPIEQWGVVLKGARDPELAASFEAFLRSTTGRTILERHDYLLPPG
ncbi:MAG TPA: molybdate ABC transporter substrate-binding protein [Anaeromyxobacteraceae bacterium]|nr:molybdate ABC transporter substrate-binding protein [Anaeromyxobacteraceae bacterium]